VSDLEWRKIREAKKFPDSFKPLVHAVGRKAIDLGIVGDALFDAMPFLIRYNRFTMKVGRLVAIVTLLMTNFPRNTSSTSYGIIKLNTTAKSRRNCFPR
jgi:hypothetical protein